MSHAAERPSVLVVEDDYDLSVVFAAAARDVGCEVQVLRSGDTALMWLNNTEPDLVVLDLFLPRVPGGDILHYIRSEERLGNTKVIVVTAYRQLEEGLRDHADLILMKPVTYQALRDAVAQILSGGEGQQL